MASPKDSRQAAVASVQPAATLAERLFAANWSPHSGYVSERLARQCIEAAEAFDRVRNSRTDPTTASN